MVYSLCRLIYNIYSIQCCCLKKKHGGNNNVRYILSITFIHTILLLLLSFDNGNLLYTQNGHIIIHAYMQTKKK